MCTLITTSQKPKPRVAKKDIVVYKTGYKSFDPLEKVDYFKSAYRYYMYHADELHETSFSYDDEYLTSDCYESELKERIPENRRCFVSRGFHSFASIDRANKSTLRMNLAEFVIPKGALYYINEAENVVSNKIIFKRFI